ncbi:hypothetical protein V8C86DRAFT_2700789 [Haematococcus lacustris]
MSQPAAGPGGARPAILLPSAMLNNSSSGSCRDGGQPSLPDLLGGALGAQQPGLSAAEAAEFRKKAEELWKQLDHMAEHDPQAYAKFLQQQAGEAQAACAAEPAASGTAPGLILRGRLQGGSPSLAAPASTNHAQQPRSAKVQVMGAGAEAGAEVCCQAPAEAEEVIINVWPARGGLLPTPALAALTPELIKQAGTDHSHKSPAGPPSAASTQPPTHAIPVVHCIATTPPLAAKHTATSCHWHQQGSQTPLLGVNPGTSWAVGRQVHVAVHAAWLRAVGRPLHLAVLVEGVVQWATAQHGIHLVPDSRQLQVNEQWLLKDLPPLEQILLPFQQPRGGADICAVGHPPSPGEAAGGSSTGGGAGHAPKAGGVMAPRDKGQAGHRAMPLVQVLQEYQG